MNSKIQALGFSFILAAASVPVAAQEDIDPNGGPCRIELQLASSVDWLGPLGRGYEVFAGGESYETVAVEMRHSGATCRYALTGSAASGSVTPHLTSGASSLGFDILSTTNGPSLLSPDYFGTQTSRIEGQFAAGSSVQMVPLLVAIPAGQFVRSGTYQGQALLRVFTAEEGSERLQAEVPLTIATRVASGLEIRSPDFGPGLRETSIDLGDISGAAEREIDFTVRANADVNVSFRSQNGGRLAHAQGAPGIAYQLNVRGIAVDPSAGNAIPMPFREDGAEHDVPIRIEIPNSATGRAAGYYRDTLLVTFTVP